MHTSGPAAMPHQSHHHDADALRPPLGRIALGALAAPALIGLLFVGAATSREGGPPDAALGLAAALAGAVAGLAVFFAAGPRPAASWPMITLFAGGVRLLAALAIALPLYLVAAPDKLIFWGVFLAAALASIFGEVAGVAPFLRSLTPGTAPGTAPNATTHPEARSA